MDGTGLMFKPEFLFHYLNQINFLLFVNYMVNIMHLWLESFGRQPTTQESITVMVIAIMLCSLMWPFIILVIYFFTCGYYPIATTLLLLYLLYLHKFKFRSFWYKNEENLAPLESISEQLMETQQTYLTNILHREFIPFATNTAEEQLQTHADHTTNAPHTFQAGSPDDNSSRQTQATNPFTGSHNIEQSFTFATNVVGDQTGANEATNPVHTFQDHSLGDDASTHSQVSMPRTEYTIPQIPFATNNSGELNQTGYNETTNPVLSMLSNLAANITSALPKGTTPRVKRRKKKTVNYHPPKRRNGRLRTPRDGDVTEDVDATEDGDATEDEDTSGSDYEIL